MSIYSANSKSISRRCSSFRAIHGFFKNGAIHFRSSGLLSCGLFKISRVDYYPLCGLCTTLLWALQDTSRVDYTPVDYSPVWALHHTLLWAPVGSPVVSLLCAAKLLCSGARLLCSGAKLFCSGAGHLSLGVLANSFHAYPATGALRLATHDMYSNDARGNLVTCPLRTLWCFSSARPGISFPSIALHRPTQIGAS